MVLNSTRVLLRFPSFVGIIFLVLPFTKEGFVLEGTDKTTNLPLAFLFWGCCMAKRTGVPSLMWVATRMCTLLAKFTPVIIVAFPGSTALHAALAAAGAACATLNAELAQVRDYGD